MATPRFCLIGVAASFLYWNTDIGLSVNGPCIPPYFDTSRSPRLSLSRVVPAGSSGSQYQHLRGVDNRERVGEPRVGGGGGRPGEIPSDRVLYVWFVPFGHQRSSPNPFTPETALRAHSLIHPFIHPFIHRFHWAIRPDQPTLTIVSSNLLPDEWLHPLRSVVWPVHLSLPLFEFYLKECLLRLGALL